MLRIIQSNRMEALQTQFNAVIKHAPLDSLFKKEVVLVQSPGMSQWLKIGLCEDLGVAAQIDFPLPSSFIWRLYQQLLENIPAESAFNKPNLAWKISAILPACLSDPLYEPLARYLEDDQDGLKSFMLSEKIADVFDQYLMYRPNWLEIWESGIDELNDTDVESAPWQPDLWRKLVSHTANLGQSPWHRANMHKSLLDAIATAPLAKLPERISVFGISALPPSQLEIINQLASRIDVLLYFFNPSDSYWGDLVDEKTQAKIKAKYAKMPNLDAGIDEYFQVGNPLLGSWGKLGKEYLEQLLALDATWLDRFVADFDNGLLGHVQREIYELAFKGQSIGQEPDWYVSDIGRFEIKNDDYSIRVQDCHTPLREVEILHDYLLSCLEQDSTLTPKDIIVMMPDVGSYSPYIEAVFGGAGGKRSIPYAIADLSLEQEKPILQSFLQLVNLPFSRFKRSEIMDLLSVEPIAQQFGIEQEEFEQLNVWLDRAAVKWGIDGQHKQEFELPELDLNTWQLGLNKLLLGYAMADETVEFNGVFGLDEVEGMSVNTLSKFIAFVDALIEAKSALALEASLAEKAQVLLGIVSVFYHPDSESSWDILQIQHVIDGLESHYSNRDYVDAISPKVLTYLVQQGLNEKGVGQRFLIGSVNFCTLMPMRAVPFKVVCLLGMNDQDYPRQVQPIGFDLVAKSIRQKGDRSRKLDDRYLFLEALLSARDKFYISFNGRSCFNNEPQVPSVLVSELLEYLDRAFYVEQEAKSVSEFIWKQAPLQPFNALHYQQGEFHSYNPTWLVTHEQSENEAEQIKEVLSEIALPQLDVTQLIRGVLNPQALFYQQTLGVRLQQIEDLDGDDEPFSLDALSRYQYLSEFLECMLEGKHVDDEQWLQRGALPQSNVGKLQLTTMHQRVERQANFLKALLANPKEPVEVTLSIEGIELQGCLPSLYERQQVFYRSASIKAKDLIAGFIWHCVACGLNETVTTNVVGLDERAEFKPLDAKTAMLELTRWLKFYLSAMKTPKPFFPTSSLIFAQSEDMGKAIQKYQGGQYIGRGDCEDPYVRLCFGEVLQAYESEFIELANDLLKPILAVCEVIEHESA